MLGTFMFLLGVLAMSTPFIMFGKGDLMEIVTKYDRKQMTQISGFFFVGLLCISIALYV